RLHARRGTVAMGGGGTIRNSERAGGHRQLNAALDNQGTLTVAQTLSMNSSQAVDSNSGTITLTSGDLSINSSPNFSTTGAIDIGGGRTFTISGGTFNFDAGSVTGSGTLALSSTTATFTPDFSNATTTLTVNSSTVNGPGTLTNAAGQTLTLINSTINAALVNQGALVIRAGDTISGSFTTTADATLTVQADGFFSNALLTVSQGFTNFGLIELTCVNAATQARLDVTSGTLVNAGGGTIRSSVAAGGDRQLNAALDNQGTLTVAQTLSMNSSQAVDSNSGTITLTSGDLSINSSPNFSTTGAIDIGGGRTFTISGGTFNFDAGSVTGSGTLALSSTTATFTPDFSNATTTLTVNSSTVNGPGTLTNAAGQTLTLINSTINAALVNQGALV